jgi:hypothetical protein
VAPTDTKILQYQIDRLAWVDVPSGGGGDVDYLVSYGEDIDLGTPVRLVDNLGNPNAKKLIEGATAEFGTPETLSNSTEVVYTLLSICKINTDVYIASAGYSDAYRQMNVISANYLTLAAGPN